MIRVTFLTAAFAFRVILVLVPARRLRLAAAFRPAARRLRVVAAFCPEVFFLDVRLDLVAI